MGSLRETMAPKVQLLYFDGRGRGEIIRMILTYGGVEFEDKRVSFEEWPQIKPTTKCGFIPELKWGDNVLVQSNAITRFAAREVGIAGKNSVEMAQCDAIVDFCSEVIEAAYSVHFFFAPNASQEARAKFKGKLDSFVRNMEKLLEPNGGEWMVGGGFTLADLYVTIVLSQWVKVARTDFESPTLTVLSKRVSDIPKIKSFIANRPDRP